ncbi:MAG: di-heme oxidoredictase family protein [Thermodesulfobacteriota bacterium]
MRVTEWPVDEGIQEREEGDGAFEANFVTSPSPVNPGLGPVFNNKSCQSCHANNGRGKPDDILTSLTFRVSVPGGSGAGGPSPAGGVRPPAPGARGDSRGERGGGK